MEDTSTVSTPSPARASGRRGAPSRLLRVESFVGIAANEAAQAVRRAGLKPGLERSFGCEPELTGRVVAQEPEPGAELARNGLVTLYVAAPGATGEPTPERNHPTRVLAQAEPASQSESPSRRRKPGRLEPPPTLDIPPAPRPPRELPGARWAEREADDAPVDRSDLDELGEAPDEYVIAADELFARGGARVRRRRAPAAVQWLGGRLRASSKLLRVALALLALWLLVAVGALLLAHGTRRAVRGESPAARAATHAPTARPRQLPRSAAAPPKPARRARRPRPRAPRRAVRAAARPVPSTSAPSSPSPVTRAPAPSSSTEAARPEGGLFSP
jgi:hypothetical protein